MFNRKNLSKVFFVVVLLIAKFVERRPKPGDGSKWLCWGRHPGNSNWILPLGTSSDITYSGAAGVIHLG